MTIRLSEEEAKRLGLTGKKSGSSQYAPTQTKKRYKTKPPQQVLFECCQVYWPDCVAEYQGAVPGRRFRLDIAFVDQKLAVEMDGWQYHSKKNDFQHDRERQNLLTLHGWRILRFTSKDVRSRLTEALGIIQQCLEQTRKDGGFRLYTARSEAKTDNPKGINTKIKEKE